MLLAALFVSASAGIATAVEPHPIASADLMRTAAGLGASFLLAFVIEATWLAPRIRMDPSGERLIWAVTGLAVCGLWGVVQLVAHSDRVDELSAYWLWWSLLSLGLLGLSVCIQPALAHALESDD